MSQDKQPEESIFKGFEIPDFVIPKRDLYGEAKASASSFANWIGAVQYVCDYFRPGVNYPKSIMVDCPKALTDDLLNGQQLSKESRNALKAVCAAIQAMAEHTGFPVFIKNSFTANKHEWKDSCILHSADEEEVLKKIGNMALFLTFSPHPYAPHLIVREMIKTEAKFTAFNDMPITQEFRFFARDGVVASYQPYWPAEAFNEYAAPSIPDWKDKLEEMKVIDPDDLTTLGKVAAKVSSELGGYWSIDFLKDKDGKWWLIDMAEGDHSYVNRKDLKPYNG